MDKINEQTLIKLQSYSGLSFSTFLCAHLFGHATSHFGIDVANGFMVSFRNYYQFPFYEVAAIMVSVSVHATVGIIRVLKRNRLTHTSSNKKDSGKMKKKKKKKKKKKREKRNKKK